ncbi:MAG: RNA methyltransferase, partial [Calditrichaeota bacterium]
LVDPPLAGMHSHVLRQIVRLRPGKVLSVSCNPTTFARDARGLAAGGYELRVVQPVDMFPMTPHIEVVGLLVRTA